MERTREFYRLASNAQMKVGNIGNYYGELFITTVYGKFYWGIENWDGTDWERIPEELYNRLKEYEFKRDKTGG